MSDSITFNYVRTKEDYWRAIRAFRRADLSRWFVWVSGVLAVSAVVFAVYGVTNSWYGIEIIIPIILSLVMAVATIWWIVSIHRKIAEHAAPLGDEDIEGTADAEGVTLDSVSVETRVPWTSIVVATETPDDFLLYEKFNPIGGGRFYYIPKQAFVGALVMDRFRGLLRAYVPNFRAR